MLRRYWRHLVGISVLVALVGYVVAALSEFLEPHFSREMFNSARGWLKNNDGPIQRVVALIGLIGTITATAIGLFRAWHFSDPQLPDRLQDLIEAEIPDLDLAIRANHEKVAVAFTEQATDDFTAIAETRRRLLDVEDRARASEGGVRGSDKEIDNVERALNNRKKSRAAQALSRGAEYLRAANQGINKESNLVSARKEFEQAVADNPADFNAQKTLLRLYRDAKMNGHVTTLVRHWVETADRTGQEREQGLARLELGVDNLSRSSASSKQVDRNSLLEEARDELDSAIEYLKNNAGEHNHGADPSLGRALYLIGDVRVELYTVPTAINRYREAMSIYRNLLDFNTVEEIAAKIVGLRYEVYLANGPQPSLRTPPIVEALVDVGDAYLAMGEFVSAQSAYYNAQMRVRMLPHDNLRNDLKTDLLGKLQNRLERARNPTTRQSHGRA